MSLPEVLMKACHALTRTVVVPLLVLAAFTVSCREAGEPTAPGGQAATAEDNGAGSPTVSSVVPGSYERGVTLDIEVNGSGLVSGLGERMGCQCEVLAISTIHSHTTHLLFMTE